MLGSYKWKERKICHFISALYLFKYVKSSYRIWNIRRHLLTHSLAATLLCLYSYTFHTQKKALISLLFFEDCLYLAMGGRRNFFFIEEWEIFLYFSIHSKTAMSHCVFVSTHIRYHEILSFFSLYFNQIESVYILFFEKRSATNMITIETIEEKQKTWDDVWQGNFHFFILFFKTQKNLVLIIN